MKIIQYLIITFLIPFIFVPYLLNIPNPTVKGFVELMGHIYTGEDE